MKKIFAVIAAVLLMATSCSDDSSSNNGSVNVVLLKKIIEQYEDGTLVTTSYQYDEAKLKSITRNDGRQDAFTYTGDQVTKIDHLENSALLQQTVFEYDSEGKLATTTKYIFDEENPTAEKTVYTYNADGTISTVVFRGDHESQTEIADEGTLTIANDNITGYSLGSGNSTYTFDSGINPVKNVTGIGPVNIGWHYGGVNNITSATYTDGQDGYSTTYTYNSDNYPVSAIKEQGGQTIHIWYMY